MDTPIAAVEDAAEVAVPASGAASDGKPTEAVPSQGGAVLEVKFSKDDKGKVFTVVPFPVMGDDEPDELPASIEARFSDSEKGQEFHIVPFPVEQPDVFVDVVLLTTRQESSIYKHHGVEIGDEDTDLMQLEGVQLDRIRAMVRNFGGLEYKGEKLPFSADNTAVLYYTNVRYKGKVMTMWQAIDDKLVEARGIPDITEFPAFTVEMAVIGTTEESAIYRACGVKINKSADLLQLEQVQLRRIARGARGFTGLTHNGQPLTFTKENSSALLYTLVRNNGKVKSLWQCALDKFNAQRVAGEKN